MYSMVCLSDEIVILRDDEELFVIDRSDTFRVGRDYVSGTRYALDLYANLIGGAAPDA